MAKFFELIEANIPEFFKVRTKYMKCKHRVEFKGEGSCTLFRYRLDTSYDVLHHCTSCKANTKKPTVDKRVRVW